MGISCSEDRGHRNKVVRLNKGNAISKLLFSYIVSRKKGTTVKLGKILLGVTSHAPNLLLVLVGLEARVKVRPPLKEHRVADELEPGCELE